MVENIIKIGKLYDSSNNATVIAILNFNKRKRAAGMEIILKEVIKEGIPLLLIYKKNSLMKSIIVLFHKLISCKEDELPLAYELAKEDFFVIAIDMYGHGKRRFSFIGDMRYEFNYLLRDIKNTSNDVNRIMSDKAFFSEYQLNNLPVKLVGVSIGATIALYCASHFEKVSALASLIGTYDLKYIIEHEQFELFKIFSVSDPVIDYEKAKVKRAFLNNLKEKIVKNGVRTIFMNGIFDSTVPYGIREEFHEEIKEIYCLNGLNQYFDKKEYKTGHEVSDLMKRDLIEWFNNQCSKEEEVKII